MVGHDDVVMELIIAEYALVIVQRLNKHSCDFNLAKVKRTGRRMAQDPVHVQKGLP
jgi:hypothetical protein